MKTPELTQTELLRYSRHLLLPEVGLEGQQKLKAASVLIVGTGGLGSPLALYLAAAGIGRLGLVDYDAVDRSNLQRQIVHGTHTTGWKKVDSAAERLRDLNPDIHIDTYDMVFNSENALDLADPYQILVDGTDNFPTRYLLNDLAVLTGKPYVYGSIFRFEGQISVFDARRGPCYRCLFPAPPPPDSAPSCAEAGVFGVLPGTVGTIQATEVIKLILGIGKPLIGRLLLYDALEMILQEIKLRKNPDCPVCGTHPVIHELIDYEAYCGVPVRSDAHAGTTEWDISPVELKTQLGSQRPPLLIDVRTPVEQQIAVLPGALLIPLEELPAKIADLPKGKRLVLFCRQGVRSARGVRMLRAAGFDLAFNLAGGSNAWSREVDPAVNQY
ncbi:MAG TPA: molybdopterin-synthase adenylyltransferase MoeB [Longilinea sp.]|nr:molybdopterin-synthase adenylyltransferase MoeB [Longilinea sp.]